MENIDITIYKEKKIKKQEDLFGIFFEDLNHAADGGLYGEMVQNRSFEFDVLDNKDYNNMTAWEQVSRGMSIAQTYVDVKNPLNQNNLHYLRLEVTTAGIGGGVRNNGYGSGMYIKENEIYTFSCFYRRTSNSSTPIYIRLESADGDKVYSEVFWEPTAKDWDNIELELKSCGTDTSARLILLAKEPIRIDLDMISLFPESTFLKRKNGMRADIAEMIKDMKPSFMRFPGGCLAHIGSLDSNDRNSIYRWKNTIGKLEERPSRRNNWNYNQSFGLGYFEYFQFCEDINAEPIPVIAAGYDPHFLRAVPLSEIEEWIYEALDIIEFANGDKTTKWGKVRVDMGHSESFNLKYIAIGNEEVGDEFFERFEIISQAVREKYPYIKIIGSAGPATAGSEFDKGWKQARDLNIDFVDEHFYQCPEWFIANADRYKNYSDEGSKAFLGEYASHGHKWFNALSEAAFMIGMERSPGLGLACYAPLLCHVDYINWTTNLIYFNNHQVFGTACYYMQKLFMNHQGTDLLSTSDNMVHRSIDTPSFPGKVAVKTTNANVDIINFKVVDNENNILYSEDELILSPENNYKKCCDINTSKYSIEFNFKLLDGRLIENLDGLNSFNLEFGIKDDKNKLIWVFNGWQRLIGLNEMCNGCSYDMGMYKFEPKLGNVYNAKVVLDDDVIEFYIDNVKYCKHKIKLPIPDTIYYSATSDDNDVIVKLANLEKEAKEISINLDEYDVKTATAYCIEDVDLDSENSFDEPRKIYPEEKDIIVKDGKAEYTLKGNSFSVIRLK
ncbi:MAG: alpha-L-arabinofuranosidase C-terminal domain-containing protein [Lachnospirales bacterium]